MFLLTAAFVPAGVQAAATPSKTSPPLKYRIVSFHRGRADKDLIRRAAELGFNGVEFQLEGSVMGSLNDFAERNRKEGYVELCHSLGMKVTLWVHELSDIPGEGKPGYLGPVELGNEKLWKFIDDRYEAVLGKLVPDVDGLTLTTVETQINATDTELMIRLVGIIRDKCHKYGKSLTVRTFTWHPEELEGVMGCIKRLPKDVIIMTKCVPQDWQLRGINDKAIGAVGDHDQLVEYDVAGEYFLMDAVANCMPDLLKSQFDYGLTKGVDGICVRVDRYDTEVLHNPQEVNLWALGMFATGKADRASEVWRAWAAKRYGKAAADGVIQALKPTLQVVTECLNIGSFSFGDTRGFPPNGDRDALRTNWANFRWDKSYVPEYQLGLKGDPAYTAKIEEQKRGAAKLAQKCLDKLEMVKEKVDPNDYAILRTKLLTNKVQLAYRAPMMLAYLRYRRAITTTDEPEKRRLANRIREDLNTIRAVADAAYPPASEIEYLGRKWRVGAPSQFDPKRIREWANQMESLLSAQGMPPEGE